LMARPRARFDRFCTTVSMAALLGLRADAHGC
jgi:hypothetical protein